MVFEVVLRFYYWCLVHCYNQADVYIVTTKQMFYIEKWVLLFVIVLLVPINQEQSDQIALMIVPFKQC